MNRVLAFTLVLSFVLGCFAIQSGPSLVSKENNTAQDTEETSNTQLVFKHTPFNITYGVVAPIRTVVVAASYKSRHPFVTISLPNSANPYKLSITFVKILAGVTALYCYGLSRKQNVFKNITGDAVKSFQTGLADKTITEEPLDPNLWYIHGVAYDLEKFMYRHPGGFRPLMIARGRDCTELFESYHCLTDVPRQMLSKFAVPSKNQKNYVSMFNWDMSSPANKFQVELRQRVREHLRKNNINTMVPNTVLFGYFAVTLFTMWMTYQYYWSGAWWASIVIPTLWWITFIQTFHDATHFAYHRNEIISNFYVYLYPYFSSPTTWDHQHVIGHHIFTNIFKKDPDLNHGMPAFRVHPRFRFRPWMKFQMLWVWFVWFVSTFYLSFVYDFTGVSTGVYHGILPYQKFSKPRMGLHLLGRAISLFLTTGIPFTIYPFWQALWWSVSFYSVYGFFFMLTTQVNHITEDSMDGAELKNECWAIHQINTSHDFAHGSYLWWLLSGGLNLQIEHHLFPGINSNHLLDIAPIVQELCKKYGVRYNYSSTYLEAIIKYLRVVANGAKDNNAELKQAKLKQA